MSDKKYTNGKTSKEINDYNREKYDRIGITVPKGEREIIKSIAQSMGMSTNEYIYQTLIKGIGDTNVKCEVIKAEEKPSFTITNDEINLLKKYSQQSLEIQNVIRKILGMKPVKDEPEIEKC